MKISEEIYAAEFYLINECFWPFKEHNVACIMGSIPDQLNNEFQNHETSQFCSLEL